MDDLDEEEENEEEVVEAPEEKVEEEVEEARWGLLPALVELLDLHGRAIHALPVSI